MVSAIDGLAVEDLEQARGERGDELRSDALAEELCLLLLGRENHGDLLCNKPPSLRTKPPREGVVGGVVEETKGSSPLAGRVEGSTPRAAAIRSRTAGDGRESPFS